MQTIDLAPTLLDYFDVDLPESVQGVPLGQTVADDAPVRQAGLFGTFGGHVNVTDGRYVYMRAPSDGENGPIYEYTLMPTHMRGMFSVDELQEIELAEPFDFSKNCRMLKIAGGPWINPYIYGSLLFDLQNDPGQEHPIVDAEIEKRMIGLMVDLMRKNDAPPEQYQRLGIPQDGNVGDEHLNLQEARSGVRDRVGNTDVVWVGKGKTAYHALLTVMPADMRRQVELGLEQVINAQNVREIDQDTLVDLMGTLIPENRQGTASFIAQIVELKGR